MWLIVSLTFRTVVGFFHNRQYCLEALSCLEHSDPDCFEEARYVSYYVHSDEIQHYLNPIIMACLDDHNIVIN